MPTMIDERARWHWIVLGVLGHAVGAGCVTVERARAIQISTIGKGIEA